MEKILFDFNSSKLPWITEEFGNREIMSPGRFWADKNDPHQNLSFADFKCSCGKCRIKLRITTPEFINFYPGIDTKDTIFSLEIPENFIRHKSADLDIPGIERLISHLELVKKNLLLKKRILGEFLPICQTYQYKNRSTENNFDREFKIMVKQTLTEMQYILMKCPVEITKLELEKAAARYEEGLGIIFTESFEGFEDDDTIVEFRNSLIKKSYWPKKVDEWVRELCISNNIRYEALHIGCTSFN